MTVSIRFAFLTLTLAAAACSSSSSTSSPGTGTDGGTASGTDGGGGGGTDGGGSTAQDAAGGTSVTGKLGMLGAVQPIVSSVVISNSGETLVYLATAKIDCTTVATSRWLGSLPAGSQVVELVIKGNPSSGQTVMVPPGEVNYAPGGKSSAYEVVADSGSITFTSAKAMGPVEGTFNASYADGSTVTGTFNASFCPMGQNY